MRVDVKPELLRWARERARLDAASLTRRFPRLEEWEAGDARPTMRQLEDFARATHAPIGFLFLSEPPVEKVPIPDFRTVADRGVERPSPDLLDTLYLCQQRQEWYREFAVSEREPALAFVGSLTLQSSIDEAAARMARDLNFVVEERRQAPTWTEALRRFITRADEAGILVMVNGVVGNNNRRKLSPQEFRGFALSDPHAPLVFINGADSKAAQMFTLAHELAHIWLGATALSDAGPSTWPSHPLERWCSQVAAKLLQAEVAALNQIETIDFTSAQAVRVSRRFERALVVSTLEGRTLYTESFRLLGFSKLSEWNRSMRASSSLAVRAPSTPTRSALP